MALLVITAGAAISGNAAAAETYPVKPVRVIAAFPPGGFVDFTTRVLAAPLGTALGQQVIVDNRGGAGGIVGTELAARAAPDGYTLTVGSAGTHAVNQALYRKLPYNVLRDFHASCGCRKSATGSTRRARNRPRSAQKCSLHS